MEDKETEQYRTRVPSTHQGQVDSDFALAMVLQEQERVFLTLTMSDSDSDEFNVDDGIDDDPDYDGNEDNAIDDAGEYIEAIQLEYLEEEYSSDEQDMEEDDIDPDELSYEELTALGEIVGIENRGLSADAMASSLRPSTYKCQFNSLDRCVVCQVEYENGELIVELPCEHPYHSECISKWLQIKKVCPICSVEVSSPGFANNA